MATPRGQRVYQGPHVTAYFDLNYTGVARYALTSDDLADALHDVGDAGMAHAQQVSPRGDNPRGTAYADSFRLTPYIETRTGRPPFPRGAYTLANISAHATLVEFGNGQPANPGHRIFAQLLYYMRAHARERR